MIAACKDQLCIGSDYDRLINPVWFCQTASNLNEFKSLSEDNLVAFAKDSNVAFPVGFDAKAFSKRLFYENGRDFILKRWDILHA